ncbi:Putative histone H3 (Lys9) methyltransferase [Klebsormidium nitens]|uniref:Putative histone H3 (Lys9) methyltransferase n=1 Tax=Klebsormidium nitens TaxID=105231 RepID=A0A1Y1I1X1_KLENI|nr:Putative histone H3 (Lys9) methyltransferase [Klebsormidium nitens]|eukprot:GAQ84920.1 Putative histone H3 (Lys9) methyltransferase [Klebsormidium nitens]
MDRAIGNLPPGVVGGSVYDRVAPLPHGPPTLAPPPFSSEGLGPIVRLPNGLFGFDHLALSYPRVEPPPWERESSDWGLPDRGLPNVRGSLSRERGPFPFEGGRGDGQMWERDSRHAWVDGRGRSMERSPRDWGSGRRGGHLVVAGRQRSAEKNPRSPGYGSERQLRESASGAEGRTGVQEGGQRKESADRASGELGDGRKVRALKRRRSESPRERRRDKERDEASGRRGQERRVEVSSSTPRSKSPRKDKAWERGSWKGRDRNSRSLTETEEREGMRSGAESVQTLRDVPEASEQRGRGDVGSRGKSKGQAKYGKDEVIRGEGRSGTRREARRESDEKKVDRLSLQIDEKVGPAGELRKKGLTLVEAIERERLKKTSVIQEPGHDNERTPPDGGSFSSRERQESGGEQQRFGAVASESGSGVVHLGSLSDLQEQRKPPVLTLFGQIMETGSPRQELNLLEKLGAEPTEEHTGCPPSLAQTSPCSHVVTKAGSPKQEDEPIMAATERSAFPDEPRPPGNAERFEALFRPATQNVPLSSFLSLKQPPLSSPKQPWEIADKETQTSPADFAPPSVAKQLYALQAHPLYWLCFEEMPAKDLKRADWAANFQLGWGGVESGKAGTRDGERSGSDLGGVVAERASLDQHEPPASWRIEKGEPRAGVDADGFESDQKKALGSANKEGLGRAVEECGQKSIGLQSCGGVKRGVEWLEIDQNQAFAQPKKVARVAGDASGDRWPKGDVQAGTLSAEYHRVGRESSLPVWGGSQGKAGEVEASRREEEEASASRFRVPADLVEKTVCVHKQLVEIKQDEALKPRSQGEALGKGGAGSGLEESRGHQDDEDVPLKMLKALRVQKAANEVKAERGPASECKQGESATGMLLESTARKGQKIVSGTGLDRAIVHAHQLKPLPVTHDVSAPVVQATGIIEQPVASGHVAEPSPKADVWVEGVVIPELPGAEGAKGDGRSCALCGAGPSRTRGEWYCATCGRRDEACACTRPLRAHVKSRMFATKYSGAKAVVHQLCAFWTPSVYQPGDGEAFVGLTKAVIHSTGSPNSGGKKRSPVRCTYCNQVGATSRCRVESSCHSVYHYTCALAAGCRMHDGLENSGLSVACPDHFHVNCQVRRGEIAPPRQLPWAASRSGPKRPQPDTSKRSKKAGGTKRTVVKPPVTLQARKSTVRHLGGQAAVHQTEGRKHVSEAEERGTESGEWEGSERGFGESPQKRSRDSSEPRRPASELSPSCREVSRIKPEKQSLGGGSNRGRKRGNRELMSILADVPKQKKLPSIEAQLEKQRDMLLKRQDVGKSKRAAIVEDVSLDAALLALVSELAPQVHRVMRRLVERVVDGSEGKRRVVNGERNGRLEREVEGAGQLLGPTVGFSNRGSPGGLGQLGRVVGAAEVARLLGGVSKAGGTTRQEAPGNVESPAAVLLAEALAGELEPGYREPTVEPGEESDEGTELVDPLGPTYDDVSSDVQTDEVTEVGEKQLAEISGAVGDLEAAKRSEEGPKARGIEVDGTGSAYDVTAADPCGQAREWTENGRQEADEEASEFACAACGGAGGLSEMKRHPALPAVLCEECVQSFNSANFSDRCKAGVERHCQLCGRREKVRPRCDGCCKTVCQRCLARVLGPEQQRAIADLDAWLCFSCDLAQLEGSKSDMRRFEQARVRQEGRENTAGLQMSRAGAVGVGQGGVGTASGADWRGEGQNFLGAAEEGTSSAGEGQTNAALAVAMQTDRTEQLEERATSPLLGERRTKVEPGASGVKASASRDGKGPEVHACSWAGCGKVFSTPRARNGHLSKHFRPCASAKESGAGRGQADQRLGENAGAPRSAAPVEGRKRTGSTAEWCEREDKAKGVAALTKEVQVGPRPGLVEPTGSDPESGRGEQRVFACAACGASQKCSQQRQHPSLPVAVCQDCSRTIDSADYGGKDVRGWDRLCQVCGIESPTSERRRCESCSCAACDRCVERLLGGRMLAAIRGGAPWLCFACDSEQLEEAKTDRGGVSEDELEPGAESSKVNKASEADVVSVSQPNGVLMEEKGALGKRSREGDAHMGPVEVSEPWGFCQCDSCVERYTGKKDAQSPATRPLVSSPGTKAPPKKSGTRPWAAYSRVGARLVHADISGGKEKVPIPFTNDVDDDVSPLEMDYITGFRLHPDLADFHERFAPADGCSGCCPDGADHPDSPLNQHVRDLEAFEGYALRTAEDDQRFDWQRERMRGRLFYDENRLLLLPPELHPTIIECNPRCPCWPGCPNSTLQRGASVHLELFKTDNGRGFGVRTREDIQRGRLIGQYVGEVITSEEANKRNSVYLFNMDHHVRSAEQQDEVYVVDGGPASSIIRYINHSCDPNLAIYSVYTDTLHPGKPLLALYAIKDIVAGTELAYDYKYGDPVQASPGSTDGHIECRCGAKNCQKWLPDPTGIKSEHQD